MMFIEKKINDRVIDRIFERGFFEIKYLINKTGKRPINQVRKIDRIIF